MKTTFLLTTIFLAFTFSLFPQEKVNPDSTTDDYPVFDLQEIVVTANRIPRKVIDITSAVSVISQKEIEASNADYVMDVIGSQPGIYIRKDAIFGRQSIEIRGLGSNCRRIQTLIDGRPEKMSLFGCTVTQTLPLSNIERIEVVRGPESVLYGTDALGGVVNIITRRLISPGFETDALLSYGAFNSYHTLLKHGGNTNHFDYYLTFDYKGSDGHRDNSNYKGMDLSGRIGYEMSNHWRTELSAKYFTDNAQDPGTVRNPFTRGDKREYDRYSWDFDLMGTWAKGDVALNVYQNVGEHQFTMPSIDDFWHSKDSSYGVTLKSTYELIRRRLIKNVITTGYDYKYEWAETLEPWNSWARQNMPARFMNIGEFERYNNDIFAFNELTINKFLNTLGVRFHHNESYGWKILPQVGLLYHFSSATSGRIKIGKGFRQAKFSELYLYPAHNPALEPEENWSYEFALNHKLINRVALSINPFYMDIKNFIQTVPNNTPPPMYINKNSGEFYIRGIELGIDFFSLVKNLKVTLFGTYMDIEDPPGTGHANRQGQPEFKFNGLINYQLRQLTLAIDLEYISGLYDANLFANSEIQKVDDFFVTHLKTAYQINNNFKLFLGIENLFNTDYEQFPGYPMPGISVNSGIRMNF